MSFSNATKVFMISILAVPVTYGFNSLMSTLKWDCAHPIWMVSSVCGILFTVSSLIIWLTKHNPPSQKKQDRVNFCVFSVFSFMGVISLIIGLELDGLISGFVGAFLKTAEPYLRSSHGVMVCYWNGTGVYAMYLMMIAAITWNNEFHDVALYWLGSSMNTIIVILLGVMSGKHGLTWGSIFYIPYLVIPPLVVLGMKQSKQKQQVISSTPPLHKRPSDVVFIIYLLISIGLAAFRGLAALDSKIPIIKDYVKTVEPYIEYREPAPFPKVQMLVYLFHYIPVYCTFVYGLIKPGCYWIPNLSLIHAGAALQAQVAHIGASLHARTPYIHRVPPEFSSRAIFWGINLILAVGPQLLAYRCTEDPSFFMWTRRSSNQVTNNNNAKEKAS